MPRKNFKNFGDLQQYEYVPGVIDSIDGEADTCSVTIGENSYSDVPIYYHCLPDSPLRDNGAIEGAAAGFAVGDEIVVLRQRQRDIDEPTLFVVAHRWEKRHCAAAFILIVSSRSEDEAFAWDIIGNALLVAKDDLASVKDAVMAMGGSNGTLLTISGSLYDNWWATEPGCDQYLSGTAGEDEFNDNIWPPYNAIDYTKMAASDCVNDENAKISKLNYPTFYQGVISELGDPDFDYYEGQTVPYHTHFVSPVVRWDMPLSEWMIPYVQYFNPVTKEDELLKTAYIVNKYGQYYPSSVPEDQKNKCESSSGSPASYSRNFYWYHSVFGFELNDRVDDWWYAAKQHLDNLTDFLYDSWDDDVHYELVGESCAATAAPLMDFGIAKNINGAVVFDFATVGWGINHGGLSMDQRYLGAISGERTQILRIYISPQNLLEGFALGCWQAINDARENHGLKKLSVNACLVSAAERHVADLAANFTVETISHTGSDGSTVTDRVIDSGYTLWRIVYQSVDGGENAGAVFGDDPVGSVLAGWEDSPPHWAAILNGDFDEVGVAYAQCENDGSHMFVAVFGFRQDTWPGFSPLDTTNILEYMNNNFTWEGAGDEIRVPKFYLA
jgi:uncharacterized protein YkwD